MKYDPLIHIPLLHETFAILKGIGEFCHRTDISRTTFYKWLRKYPKFREAYEKAHSYAFTQWEYLPLIKPDISIAYWTAIMRNRFKYFSHTPKVKTKSISDKLEAYQKAAEDGDITIQKYNSLLSSLETEFKLSTALRAFSKDGQETQKIRREDTKALEQFFISKGFTLAEAATMILNFIEGQNFLIELRKKEAAKRQNI